MNKQELEFILNQGENLNKRWYKEWYKRWYKNNRIKLSEKLKKLFTIIKADPSISIDIASEKLGISSNAVQKRFDALKEKGFIIHKGPLRGGYLEILNPEN